ncbi:Uncharacterized protein PODLI_1B008028 [Podarcis lilfordi]|uniref:MOB kinase activator 3C n=1 Tax=Podarcis lilfordi TaxID=74358 RepID=A0AA35KGZ2_9SAUR|nr:Uncharacterized protein PODLI_1B008028 [Podarcis lilfordi]
MDTVRIALDKPRALLRRAAGIPLLGSRGSNFYSARLRRRRNHPDFFLFYCPLERLVLLVITLKFEPGTQRFELHKKAQASLKSGLDLKAVVQLPPGENINDWIAVHLVDFFNRINLIYGTMSEFCTEKSCPIMSGGLKYEYRWQDDYRYKRPTKLSAPQYMCMLMDWIETLINNEDIFPTRIGVPFPKNFQQVCTKILTRLFRVFVHVYIHHFDSIISMGAEAHVNTCYKHFYYFISEFSLVDQRELEPLKEMTERICH